MNIRTLLKSGTLKMLIDTIVNRYTNSSVTGSKIAGKRQSGSHTIFYRGSESNRYENGVGFGLVNDSTLPNIKKFYDNQ